MEQPSSAPNMNRLLPWIVYVIFFAVLNETVFNVSTPNIASQFHLHPSEVSWVITIFIITFGLGTVIYGKLSDMVNIKKLLITGILTYGISSLAGFILQFSYPLVLVTRAFQGVGASAIPALVMVIIARYYPKKRRGKLFGYITSTVSFALAIGPVLGGYISGTFHWSYLFLIPLLALIAVPFIHRYLPGEKGKSGQLDLLGTILMGVLVTSLILFFTEPSWYVLIISVIALVWFIFHIRRAKEPFVDPKLFANPLYRNGLVIGFLIFSTILGINFVIPMMLHTLYHMKTETIGLIMFPGAFSAVIFGTVAGNMTVKKGSHFVVYLGLSLITLSLFVQSSVVGQMVWYISAALILMSIGFSFLQTSLVESVTNILPEKQIGVGMGFYNLVSFNSGAIGTALVSKAMELPSLKQSIHPLVSNPQAFLYSNLLLIFSLIVILGIMLYFFSFGRKATSSCIDEVSRL